MAIPYRESTHDVCTDREKLMGPLEGLKVIDLTHVMAGPTCTLMLADMGADVIKIERIPGGDDTRRSIPPTIGGESAAFMMMNRNKRGVALDLKSEGGKRALRRLLRDADVLVENYRPGTLARLGFDFEDLRRDNPGLIYCALSGFGRTGPYGHRGGFDLVAQAMSGIMSITGEGPGRPPVKCGAPLTDITCGIIAAMGVLAAYAHRQKTGRGQMVDTSLLEAGIVQTYWQSAIALATGIAPQPMGSAHPLNAPYQAFATADGWIVIGGSNQRNWLRMLEALEAQHLADDPRFRDNADRMTHLEELEAALAPYFKARTSGDLLGRFETLGVPAGPVYDINQMHQDPQVLARRMVVEVEHARLGPVRTIGLPVKFSDTPGEVSQGAPMFGQHTREVLRECGFADAEIDALLAEGAIAVAEP
jgi:crotonobetainyl-CoA:carnitine CoA-transferase CaiB-like acyl-CoA transferase